MLPTIRLHADDNVVVALRLLATGEAIGTEGIIADGRIPAGHKVAVRAITSVSTHEYMVEGTRVTELNIDSQGQSQVRFYYLEILPTEAPHGIAQGLLDKANEAVKGATEKAGAGDVWKKVVKSYPTSTHAHTIEYRLAEKADLMKIFEAADQAFTRQQEVEITVP